mmetsp:Transcript_7846/g.15589  ORF Transcript_7846/g.15589 Transcript_7846/m.15589 type:complete len:172 (+) Transcript_7846:1075-1590(+)
MQVNPLLHEEQNARMAKLQRGLFKLLPHGDNASNKETKSEREAKHSFIVSRNSVRSTSLLSTQMNHQRPPQRGRSPRSREVGGHALLLLRQSLPHCCNHFVLIKQRPSFCLLLASPLSLRFDSIDPTPDGFLDSLEGKNLYCFMPLRRPPCSSSSFSSPDSAAVSICKMKA